MAMNRLYYPADRIQSSAGTWPRAAPRDQSAAPLLQGAVGSCLTWNDTGGGQSTTMTSRTSKMTSQTTTTTTTTVSGGSESENEFGCQRQWRRQQNVVLPPGECQLHGHCFDRRPAPLAGTRSVWQQQQQGGRTMAAQVPACSCCYHPERHGDQPQSKVVWKGPCEGCTCDDVEEEVIDAVHRATSKTVGGRGGQRPVNGGYGGQQRHVTYCHSVPRPPSRSAPTVTRELSMRRAHPASTAMGRRLVEVRQDEFGRPVDLTVLRTNTPPPPQRQQQQQHRCTCYRLPVDGIVRERTRQRPTHGALDHASCSCHRWAYQPGSVPPPACTCYSCGMHSAPSPLAPPRRRPLTAADNRCGHPEQQLLQQQHCCTIPACTCVQPVDDESDVVAVRAPPMMTSQAQRCTTCDRTNDVRHTQRLRHALTTADGQAGYQGPPRPVQRVEEDFATSTAAAAAARDALLAIYQAGKADEQFHVRAPSTAVIKSVLEAVQLHQQTTETASAETIRRTTATTAATVSQMQQSKLGPRHPLMALAPSSQLAATAPLPATSSSHPHHVTGCDGALTYNVDGRRRCAFHAVDTCSSSSSSSSNNNNNNSCPRHQPLPDVISDVMRPGQAPVKLNVECASDTDAVVSFHIQATPHRIG